MRKYLHLMILIMIPMAWTIAAGNQILKPLPKAITGGEMPDFSLTDINKRSESHGETLSLSDFTGMPLLVYFGSVG